MSSLSDSEILKRIESLCNSLQDFNDYIESNLILSSKGNLISSVSKEKLLKNIGQLKKRINKENIVSFFRGIKKEYKALGYDHYLIPFILEMHLEPNTLVELIKGGLTINTFSFDPVYSKYKNSLGKIFNNIDLAYEGKMIECLLKNGKEINFIDSNSFISKVLSLKDKNEKASILMTLLPFLRKLYLNPKLEQEINEQIEQIKEKDFKYFKEEFQLNFNFYSINTPQYNDAPFSFSNKISVGEGFVKESFFDSNKCISLFKFLLEINNSNQWVILPNPFHVSLFNSLDHFKGEDCYANATEEESNLALIGGLLKTLNIYLGKNNNSIEQLLSSFINLIDEKYKTNFLPIFSFKEEKTWCGKCRQICSITDRFIKAVYLFFSGANYDYKSIENYLHLVKANQIKGKKPYYELNFKNNDWVEIENLLFSNQSVLFDVNEGFNGNFSLMIRSNRVNTKSFTGFQKEVFDKLAKKSGLVKNGSNFNEIVVNPIKLDLLTAICRQGYINSSILDEEGQAAAKEFLIGNVFKENPSFISEEEKELGDFLWGNHFSNGMGLRNKIQHGDIVNEEKCEQVYFILLIWLIILILKMNEQLE